MNDHSKILIIKQGIHKPDKLVRWFESFLEYRLFDDTIENRKNIIDTYLSGYNIHKCHTDSEFYNMNNDFIYLNGDDDLCYEITIRTISDEISQLTNEHSRMMYNLANMMRGVDD